MGSGSQLCRRQGNHSGLRSIGDGSEVAGKNHGQFVLSIAWHLEADVDYTLARSTAAAHNFPPMTAAGA